MKKTMTKIFALVLVCAMLIGFVAMIPAYAAENDSVQIVGHNVYFDDYLQIMYALDIPAGQTVEKIVLSDGTNEYAAIPYVDAEGNQINASIGGVEYPAYVADTGVSLQNIDAVVTAEVYVDGEVVVTDEYSVLQYLHKRLIADSATEAQDAMYLSLLDAAEKMQAVLNDSVTLHSTSYVKVTNGTVDGAKTEAMVAVGTALSGVTCDLVPGENQEVVWTVTEYTDAGVAGASVEKTTAEVQALVVEEGVNLTLVASLNDTSVEEPEVIANGNFVIAVNHSEKYIAMDAALNDKNRIDSVEVNVFNGAVTTDGAPEWTVTNVAGGVTLHNGSQYLTHTGGTNATFALVDEFDANTCVWTVEVGANGEIFLNSIKTPERGILFNTNSSLNQFGVYATSNGTNSAYARAMLFMVYEACEHTGNLVNYEAPTCGEAGYSGDTVCTICGALMTPGEILEATGEHTYVEGSCSVCGEADPDFGGGETGTPITVSRSVSDLIAEYGWTSSTTKQSFKLDNIVSVQIGGGSNTGKAYNGDHIRIYATDSPAGTMTISVPEGYELVSIKISTQTGTYAYLYVDGTTTDICNQEVAVSGTSVKLNSVKNGSNGKQVRVTGIQVVYQKTASASSLRFNEIATPFSRKEWF